jgi:hypothetical protein
MTLHSISLIYPEVPSNADKEILKRYMAVFRDSIACPYCHQHFKVIFHNYITSHPEWNSSRFQFFLFVVRAHNTVNKRLNKPKLATVQECLDAYRRNTQINSGIVYRQKYIEYLFRNWAREMTGDGMIHMGESRELKRITEEYWNRMTDERIDTFDMDADVLAFIDETPATRSLMGLSGKPISIATNYSNIGFRGGRFRLK